MEEEKVLQKESIVKNMVNLLPLFTVALIVLGLIKQYLYYYKFNVPINKFIGISELGLIISGDLLLLFAFLTLLSLLTVIFVSNNKKVHRFFSDEKRAINNRKFIHFLMLLTGTSYMIVLISYWTYEGFLLLIGLLIGMFLLVLGSFLKEFSTTIFPTKKHESVFFILTLTFMSVFCLTSLDILSVQEGKYTGTKIYTADTTYTSTDSSFFIGKTEKYVFIYNKKTKSTRIIPSESVLKIDIVYK